MAKTKTIGEEKEALLFAAIHQSQNAPVAGARSLPELSGLHSTKLIYTELSDNVILAAAGHMSASGRVYARGSDVLYEKHDHAGNTTLTHLRLGGRIETMSASLMANIFTCVHGPIEFPPPPWFVKIALMSELLVGRLPSIVTYANRPVFDSEFNLCAQGWNSESGVLVHGPHIEPIIPEATLTEAPAKERLPHHLKVLLGGFCFRADADVANTLAMFLTGLLANHFVQDPKGLFLVDGNQAGLGKTLLVQCVGMVMDGVPLKLLTYKPDDTELEKQLCAILRGTFQSVVLVDNAKAVGGTVISSQVIEANSVAPIVALRILGRSEMHSRPNDLLWAITMNDTRVSPDLASRGVPLRMAYDGSPSDRVFTGPSPLDYAREHRTDILGELAGMVIQWNQAGRPQSSHTHRSQRWASTVGGILQVAGFPEFLRNSDEAAAAFNALLDDLAALAEAVVTHGGPYIETQAKEK